MRELNATLLIVISASREHIHLKGNLKDSGMIQVNSKYLEIGYLAVRSPGKNNRWLGFKNNFAKLTDEVIRVKNIRAGCSLSNFKIWYFEQHFFGKN